MGNFDLGKIEEKSEEDSDCIFLNTTLKAAKDKRDSSLHKSYQNIS
jgi:hypothetical protein